MKRISVLLTTFLLCFGSARAVEGMWIPSLIDMFYSDMQIYGLKLTPEQIYSTNTSSLKDAIVQFNGGCTAEIVSSGGLIFTNHHCGLDAIQKHSTTQHDYITNGFWAKSNDDELSCPWLKVTFVKEIRDVTADVLSGTTDDITSEMVLQVIRKNILRLEKENSSTAGITAKIKGFHQGNQFFMLITQDFNDIRLVGAPPSCIGKFGGDTDNWVWPRHTGDFAIFRIYADAENGSAEFSAQNKPFQPAHFLPISVKPRQVNDFTMIYGFPGQTDQHYASGKLRFYQDVERPSRILLRQKALDAMKPFMLSDKLINIQYTAKQARIANAWKKWIGQVAGLRDLKAVDKKIAFEEEYRARAAERTPWKEKYGTVIDDLNKLQATNQRFELARAMFTEYFYSGPEILDYAFQYYSLAFENERMVAEGSIEKETKVQIGAMRSFFKDYNVSVDQKIFEACSPVYAETVDSDLLPEGFIETWSERCEQIYTSSVLLDTVATVKLLSTWNKKSISTLQKDPAILLAKALMETFQRKVSGTYEVFVEEEKRLMQIYVAGILEMFPDKKTWADANSTLRIAYGKIEGSAPHDGMQYAHFTTIDGIVQKHDPYNPDFVLTDRFLQVYEKGDFGKYLQDGELWVCFTASNHTTGGNSGSPCIDADGNLIGINFDRSWESTMSDFIFDESRCRNIMVDTRYVLWVIEKYGEAGHLLNEMKIVQ